MKTDTKGLALYSRISKTDGTTMATDRQESECRRVAERLGLHIARVYTDQGKSASHKRVVRPAYNELLADAKAGRISGVITWAYDRLTRQPEQLGEWLDLADGGFKLVTVAGELDLSTDPGRLAARIFVAVAEQEVRRKGARQVSKNRQLAEQGKCYAKVRAFGYLRGGMEPHPEESGLVKDAVAGLLAGTHSVHGIVKDWNRRGITTTFGKPWTRTSLRRVLTSWRNCALVAYRDGAEIFPAQWPAIVSQTDVEALRAMFAQPDRNDSTKDAKVSNLLTHILFCDACQVGVEANTGRNNLAYRCPKCFVSIDRTKAETEVIRQIATTLSDPGYRISATAVSVRDKRAELVMVTKTADDLALMFAEGEISVSQFKLMNEGPSSARKSLEAEISSLVEQDALAALIDGLKLTLGHTTSTGLTLAANSMGNITANAEVITERFRLMDIYQQRTVVRGLLPQLRLRRAASGGRQSAEAIRRRIVTEAA